MNPVGEPQELGRFRALFEQEIEHADRLIELLDEEYAALAGNDLARLEQCVAEKRHRVDQLEAQGQRRAAAMREAGFTTDRDGIESCIRRYDPDGRGGLINIWKNLHTSLGRCRTQNEVNGRMVETSRRYVQAALATLQRQSLPNELYGRDGSTTPDGQSHTLAKV